MRQEKALEKLREAKREALANSIPIRVGRLELNEAIKALKTQTHFEDKLVDAFMLGMICGYGVDHEHLGDDERVYKNRFRAYLNGKIKDMNEVYNDERTTLENS